MSRKPQSQHSQKSTTFQCSGCRSRFTTGATGATPVTSRDPELETSSEGETTSFQREQALSEYMRLARKRKSSHSSQKQPIEDPLTGQMLISVGRMEFDAIKAKGILDRSFPPMKIPLHKDSSYVDVNMKCREMVWGSVQEEYEYYLADGGGTAIGCDTFEVTLANGQNQSLPWTLNNYLKVSSIKYASRLRVYSVRRFKQADEISVESADSTDKESENDRDSDGAEEKPDGFFDVAFAVPCRSRYRAMWSFRCLTQPEFLYNNDITDDRTLNVRAIMDSSSNCKYMLFQDNPLRENCFLQSITTQQGEINFIQSLNLDTGQAIYCTHGEGDEFDVWTGCFVSSDVALLACVAINGFHSASHYNWNLNSKCLDQYTPLLYCIRGGIYNCVVHYQSTRLSCSFEVKECDGHVKCVEKGRIIQKGIGYSMSIEGPVTAYFWLELSSQACPGVVQGAIGGTATASVVPLDSASMVPVDCLNVNEDGMRSTLCKVNRIKDEVVLDKREVNAIRKSCAAIEKVQLIETVGTGAFGHVYKAAWKGVLVAAKVIMISGHDKVIENELSAYKTLHHPNILTFLGILRERTKITLLTNYVRGKNLYQILHVADKKEELSSIQKVTIAMQITQALVYMHTHEPPIVHLDLKPENVLVQESNFQVFLADFGLGKVLSNSSTAGRTTMQAGTPAFQPPEQLKGEMLGPGSDVYALACIVVELFGEKPVWEGLAAHTIILKVASGEFPQVDHLPEDVRGLVQQCFVAVQQRLSAVKFLESLTSLYQSYTN